MARRRCKKRSFQGVFFQVAVQIHLDVDDIICIISLVDHWVVCVCVSGLFSSVYKNTTVAGQRRFASNTLGTFVWMFLLIDGHTLIQQEKNTHSGFQQKGVFTLRLGV